MKTEHFNTFKELIEQAHKFGVERGCASTQVLLATYQSNGGYADKAVVAAMQTLGGRHAPVEATLIFWTRCVANFEVKKTTKEEVGRALSISPNKVPGFGNSFVKGEPDPQLNDLEVFISQHMPKESYILNDIKDHVHKHRKIYPNLALYTAIFFSVIGIPPQFCNLEVMLIRASAWRNVLLNQYNRETIV